MTMLAATGCFLLGGALGFLVAWLVKASEDAEPHSIPRRENLWTNTTTRPPRRTTAGAMNDPFDSQSWDSD